MRKKRLVSMMLAAAMTAGLLAGCGSGAKSDSGSAAGGIPPQRRKGVRRQREDRPRRMRK